MQKRVLSNHLLKRLNILSLGRAVGRLYLVSWEDFYKHLKCSRVMFLSQGRTLHCESCLLIYVEAEKTCR